jgi:hypothetical protein
MKSLLVLFLLGAATVVAQQTPEPESLVPVAPPATPAATPAKAPELIVGPNDFPGIRIVMTPEEFGKAGLSGLTDEQLAIINLAIARHYNQTVAKAATQEAEQMTEQAVAEERSKSWLAHVGLPDVMSTEWKNQPSVKATCTGWATGNSFKLDNGQIWEGVEPIRMELAGRDIEIQSRPNGQFDLVVDGKNTTYRVLRVK